MPVYALKCTPCDRAWDQFARVSERVRLRCPQCGAKAETDFLRTNVNGEINWRGDQKFDVSMMFDPSPEGIAKLKQDVPSIELDRRGIPKYKNDRHHKRCMREMSASMDRIRAEDHAAAEMDRRRGISEERKETAA